MLITENIFHAFLKCETKAYLCSKGIAGSCVEFKNWQQTVIEKYKKECSAKLCLNYVDNECIIGTPQPDDFKNMKYRLAIDCIIKGERIITHINALQRIHLHRNSKRAQYIPIRFIPTEKTRKIDKLLLAFDALALSDYFGKVPSFGRIMHSSAHKVVKVNLDSLIIPARALFEKAVKLIANESPPELILNKHCAECEFRSSCREKAVEKDELSLLYNMSKNERLKYHRKGIFTVTQLSYTFRPRKPYLRDNSKVKYQNSLKALAIREDKIYITKAPEISMTGTTVYLDVEGIPDQDFYYLIGVKIVNKDGSFVQHSFWANDIKQEKQMWSDCLQTLASIDNPQLIHYGSYETKFLSRMKERYAAQIEIKILDQLTADAQNLIAVIYGRIYFPTVSNSLKDIARFLGFSWSDDEISGNMSLLWRYKWEETQSKTLKEKLITYNMEDCEALERVTKTAIQIKNQGNYLNKAAAESEVLNTNTLRREPFYRWGEPKFSLSELDYINKCAYWDYQRNRIYIRSNPLLRSIASRKSRKRNATLRINKIIEASHPLQCPKCHSTKIRYNGKHRKIFYDLKFSFSAVKRWVVKHLIVHYKCINCNSSFASDEQNWTRHRHGPGMLAYVIYHLVDLQIPQIGIARSINKLFGYQIHQSVVNRLKNRCSESYLETYEAIRRKLVNGKLIHADETKVNVKGKEAFVWVFTSMEEVIYAFSETREAEILNAYFSDFKGVLISDFYAAYDSINCPQQKCLIHLILFGFNSPTLASFTIDNTPLDTPTLASGSFIS